MTKTLVFKKMGLTIGGLVLALALTGCSTNSSVKSSSDNSSKNAVSSSVATKKASSTKATTASSSATNAESASSVSTTQNSTSQVTTATPVTSSTESSDSSSSSEVTPTNRMTVVSNFAKAAGYYGSSKYAFMVTNVDGDDYTIEVRATDGDPQVQSLVGIFDYNFSTNTYTAKY